MLEPTQRFSSRVENYAKYRPHYPEQVLTILGEECGLTPAWHVADVGSGTGISTELFLRHGNFVYGVEPNGPMREAAEVLLASYPRFASIEGTAESTTLPDASVDMVVAAQAFHWFDWDKTRPEFRRICRSGGWTVLMWNERRTDEPFLQAYDRLLMKYSDEYDKVNHKKPTRDVLAAFFAPSVLLVRTCPNSRGLDFEGLKGGMLSASYTPEPGHPAHEPMIQELRRIFDVHQVDGQVFFKYDTNLYLGQL